MKRWTEICLLAVFCICVTGCGKKETGSEMLNETQAAVEPVKEPMEPVVEETAEGIALHVYCGDGQAEELVRKTVYVEEVTEQIVMEKLAEALDMGEEAGLKKISFGMHGGDKVIMLDMNRAFAEYVNRQGTAGEYIVMGSLTNTFLDCYQSDLLLVTTEGRVLETGHTVYEEYLEMYPFIEVSYRVKEMLIGEGNMKISCPQIEGLSDEQIQGKWNRIMLGTEERAMDQWGGNGTYEVHYTVKTMTEDMLSVLMDGTVQEEGSAYPYTFKYTYNIDLNTGESIRLKDHVDVKKVAENMFAGKGYYLDESLAAEFADRLKVIYESPEALARSLAGYDYSEDQTAPYGYSYIADGKVWICMEVPHALGDYVEIELDAR